MKKSYITTVIVLCCLLVGNVPVLAQPSGYYSQFPTYSQPSWSPQLYAIQPQIVPSYPAYPAYPTYPTYPTYPAWGQSQIGVPCSWYSPNQLYQCGLQLVYAKRYYDAIRVFHMFLQSYPQSSLADNALYWTGECYYAQKRYYEALSYFQRILYEYPRANKVPDALLKTALAYMSLKQYSRGCQYLSDLVRRYPNSESARKAYRWFDRCGWYSPYSGGSQYQDPYYYSDWTFPKNY